jgi:hypothetical protein
MNLLRRLSLAFLVALTLGAAKPVNLSSTACIGFEVATALTKDINDNRFTLTLTATGGQSPYYYLLLDFNSNLVSKNFTNHTFNELQPGRYRCIVSDANDCTKEQFIQVK